MDEKVSFTIELTRQEVSDLLTVLRRVNNSQLLMSIHWRSHGDNPEVMQRWSEVLDRVTDELSLLRE